MWHNLILSRRKVAYAILVFTLVSSLSLVEVRATSNRVPYRTMERTAKEFTLKLRGGSNRDYAYNDEDGQDRYRHDGRFENNYQGPQSYDQRYDQYPRDQADHEDIRDESRGDTGEDIYYQEDYEYRRRDSLAKPAVSPTVRKRTHYIYTEGNIYINLIDRFF